LYATVDHDQLAAEGLVYPAVLELIWLEAVLTPEYTGLKAVGTSWLVAALVMAEDAAWAVWRVRRSATAREVCLMIR